jgi:hypothetical protein
MELNFLKLQQEHLREVFNQIINIQQLIEDGRFIAAFRQTQSARMKTQNMIEKNKEKIDELAETIKREEGSKPE